MQYEISEIKDKFASTEREQCTNRSTNKPMAVVRPSRAFPLLVYGKI